ncbi:MAG: hypothetical protein PHQ42_03060 [Patescibacteria group bacterium]|nr:hypothetical protein [Patescibacteria group bacterium]
MTFEEIKEFLKAKGGYLANYSCADPDGKIMTAAEIIYDRAITNKVNPKFLIVLLQKEQSLIENKSPKQSQLDWATGYGCPDGSSCNPRWQGFWKQVNSASLQFRDYMENPHLYTYKAGETYTFTNPYSTTATGTTVVTPHNKATAALYNYTPHVYNGNYNFYNIWQRYFTRQYYDGALLQAEGETGVWLIQNGKKRPFLTKAALTSRFDPNKVITVNKSDLDKYPTGASIKFQNYSLIRSPRGTVFLLVDDKRHGFSSPEAFRKFGYNPGEIMDAGWEDINTYIEGKPLTATSTYPTGALLQDKKTGGVYWVYEGAKAPIWDAIFLKTKFKNKKIIPVTEADLANYETIGPVLFDDGELVKSPISPGVFLISNGEKRPIASGAVFEDLGYKWKNIITVSDRVLYLYNEGELITEAANN